MRLTRSEGTTVYATAFSTRYYVYSPELQLLAVTAADNPNLWGKTAITNSVPAMKHEIAWFAGRPIGELVDGGTIRYTFSDHLGTPILQMDTSASITWRAEYEPYGDMYVLRNGSSAAEQHSSLVSGGVGAVRASGPDRIIRGAEPLWLCRQ